MTGESLSTRLTTGFSWPGLVVAVLVKSEGGIFRNYFSADFFIFVEKGIGCAYRARAVVMTKSQLRRYASVLALPLPGRELVVLPWDIIFRQPEA